MINFFSGVLSALFAFELLAWAVTRDQLKVPPVQSRYSCIRHVPTGYIPCSSYRWESKA